MDKYITKFDYAHTRGYQVRVPIVLDGVLTPYEKGNTNKFFAKGEDTWEESLAKATIWRDKYLIENKINYLLLTQRNKRHPMKTSIRNTSGVIGVTLQVTFKACGVYYGYAAFWSKNAKQHRQQFSVNLNGECGAFLKACRLRFRHAGVLIITDIKAVPCLPDVEYLIKEK